MKKTIALIVYLTLNIALFTEQVEYKKFDESLKDIKTGHMKLKESMLDESLEDRTKPILFNLGMATIFQAMKVMDPKDKRTQTFKDEHNRIIGNVKDINGYLDIYFDEVIKLIDSYQNETSNQSNSFTHTRKKIGKLYWQMGKASAWEDCPIEPGYSEMHGETLCVTDGKTAEDYCKNMKGRLPSIKEFVSASKIDDSIDRNSRWPKYWTSNKKGGMHISITNAPPPMKPIMQTDSAASIRCVWDK